jgi:hypothetical protein
VCVRVCVCVCADHGHTLAVRLIKQAMDLKRNVSKNRHLWTQVLLLRCQYLVVEDRASFHSHRFNIYFVRCLWHFDVVRLTHIPLVHTSHVRGTEVSAPSPRIMSILCTYFRPIFLKCRECNAYNYFFQLVAFLEGGFPQESSMFCFPPNDAT